MLSLPYFQSLAEHTILQGVLDVRALILVTLIVPAAVTSATQVRIASGEAPIRLPERTERTTSGWQVLSESVMWPMRLFAHLIYRVLRYCGLVVLAWSWTFASQLRELISEVRVYKCAGHVLLLFAACAIIVDSSPLTASALTDYLREEPVWSGGSLNAFVAFFLVAGGVGLLVLCRLAFMAALKETVDEADVVAAAEFVGWGVVCAACASTVLWLLQHYSALRMVGFSTPGAVVLVLGVIVAVYLLRSTGAMRNRTSD